MHCDEESEILQKRKTVKRVWGDKNEEKMRQNERKRNSERRKF